LFGAGIVVDLPEAKANDGHLLAIVQFYGGRRHLGCCRSVSQVSNCRYCMSCGPLMVVKIYARFPHMSSHKR